MHIIILMYMYMPPCKHVHRWGSCSPLRTKKSGHGRFSDRVGENFDVTCLAHGLLALFHPPTLTLGEDFPLVLYISFAALHAVMRRHGEYSPACRAPVRASQVGARGPFFRCVAKKKVVMYQALRTRLFLSRRRLLTLAQPGQCWLHGACFFCISILPSGQVL